MHDLLIVFIVLLVLLTLISALGGSIRPHEHFWEDAKPKHDEDHMKHPHPVMKEKYTDDAAAPAAPKDAMPSPPQQPPAVEKKEDVVEGFDGDMWSSPNF